MSDLEDRLAMALSIVEHRTMMSPTEAGPQTMADTRALIAALPDHGLRLSLADAPRREYLEDGDYDVQVPPDLEAEARAAETPRVIPLIAQIEAEAALAQDRAALADETPQEEPR